MYLLSSKILLWYRYTQNTEHVNTAQYSFNLEHLQLEAKRSIWIQMQYFSESYEKLFSNLTGKKQTKWSCRMLIEMIIVIAQTE